VSTDGQLTLCFLNSCNLFAQTGVEIATVGEAAVGVVVFTEECQVKPGVSKERLEQVSTAAQSSESRIKISKNPQQREPLWII